MKPASAMGLAVAFSIGAALAAAGLGGISVFVLERFNPRVGPSGVFLMLLFIGLIVAICSGMVFGATLQMLEDAIRVDRGRAGAWAAALGAGQMLLGCGVYTAAPDFGEPLALRLAIVFAVLAIGAAFAFHRWVVVARQTSR